MLLLMEHKPGRSPPPLQSKVSLITEFSGPKGFGPHTHTHTHDRCVQRLPDPGAESSFAPLYKNGSGHQLLVHGSHIWCVYPLGGRSWGASAAFRGQECHARAAWGTRLDSRMPTHRQLAVIITIIISEDNEGNAPTPSRHAPRPHSTAATPAHQSPVAGRATLLRGSSSPGWRSRSVRTEPVVWSVPTSPLPSRFWNYPYGLWGDRVPGAFPGRRDSQSRTMHRTQSSYRLPSGARSRQWTQAKKDFTASRELPRASSLRRMIRSPQASHFRSRIRAPREPG